MLYKIFKILLYLTTKAYFRSIFIEGKESLPDKSKPVIFAANHPSSFMDPILLAVQLNRPIYFLARGDVFKNKLARYVFNQLHMIPIYTSDLSAGQMHKNDQVFDKCHDHLGENKCVLIFPEGSSKTERRLRPIKTGTARIALGAEEKYDFNLGLSIVPIGLNYNNPHFFKGDVFVNFGVRILVKDYKDQFIKEPREAVLQLTERIKEELENRIVIIEDERLEKIIEQVELLYRSTLREDDKLEEKGTQDFKVSQDIVKAVSYFAKNEPDVLEEFEKKITVYLDRLKELNVKDTQVRATSVSLNLLGRLIYFLLGFPFFLFGFTAGYIPFKLTGFITDNVKIREDFVGAVKIATGLVVFTIMYVAEAIIIGKLTNTLFGILFFIVVYPLGYFSIEYIKAYYKFVVNFKYIQLFVRKSNLVSDLKTKRQSLIDELEIRKNEFIDQLEDK